VLHTRHGMVLTAIVFPTAAIVFLTAG